MVGTMIISHTCHLTVHSNLYLRQQEEMSIITYTRILINPVDVSLVQEFRWEWHKVKGHEK